MGLKYGKFVLGLLASLLVAFPVEAQLRKWNKKMQELNAAFSNLLPELAESRPITPNTKVQLEKSAGKILELAHSINMGPGSKANPLPPESDPTLSFISHLFERETKRAYEAAKAGQVPYARAVLRTISGHCIACHTRHDLGPSFTGANLSPKAQTLTPMEKAELLAATRQFDAAFEAFEKIAGDPVFAKNHQIQWGRAVRYAFTLAVRVKKDPELALQLIDKVMALPQVPAFYASNVPAWKKSIQEWKSEGAKNFTSEEGYFMEATRLTKEARDLQQYAFDRSADVLYMRSTSVLHELLTKYPNGKRTSEAFLLAGSAYDLLEDRLVSNLSNLYYEACIRNSPHSNIAERCYERYEQNILFGYSGSAGTFVPEDVQSVLEELRGIATLTKK